MPTLPKISLAAAILVNINIMLGAGIFVNTVLLAQSAGAFGALVYTIVGILLLPLIFTFVRLLKIHEGGSFYEFGASIHPLIGFVSSLSYFIAKLASCALGVHVFVTLMQQAFPFLRPFPILFCDYAIITLFVILNRFNIRIGQSIQYGFLTIKLVPILFAIGTGLYFLLGSPFIVEPVALTSITASIPFVFYAFTGFEACCSLARTIKNPQRNAPRAILISYLGGVLLVILYQLMFYGALGPGLAQLSGYTQAFPALLQKLLPTAGGTRTTLSALLNIGIASSSLGAAYGIMYSNAWNLFTLASHRSIPFSGLFSSLNKQQIPFISVIAEGIITALYLFLSRGNQIPLQQICALGMTITYTTSSIALITYDWYNQRSRLPFSLLALASCALLIIGLVNNVCIYSAWPLILFIGIIFAGAISFMLRKKLYRNR